MANVTGTPGNDTITTTSVSSGVIGGVATQAADTINALEGNDTVDGGGGNDSILGGAGNDSLIGGSGDDTLIGNEGFDTLDGGGGNDSLVGDSGDDFMNPGSGNDTIAGGAGFDSLNYFNFPESIIFTITDNTGTAVGAGIGNDTFSQIESFRGSNGNDIFTVTSWNTTDFYVRMRGNAGNDTLNGLQSAGSLNQADYQSAATGVVATLGVSGSATDGFGGTDTLNHIYSVIGGEFADILSGDASYNEFRPGKGADTIIGAGGGRDLVDYRSFYIIAPTQGANVNLITGIAIDPWGDTDTLSDVYRVLGSTFADTLSGSNQGNRFSGGAGNDVMDGRLGADTVTYDYDSTTGVIVNLSTGTATDGLGGTDTLISIESARGSNFDDDLTGATLVGTSFSSLRGDKGNDILRAAVTPAGSAWTVADFSDQTQGMTINLLAGIVTDSVLGTDTLIGIRGATMYGNFNDTITGTAGDDYIAPDSGTDRADGGAGIDWIAYASSNSGVSVNLTTGVALDDGGATDTLLRFENIFGSTHADTLVGDAGNNVIHPNHGVDAVDGGDGIDTLDYGMFASPGAIWGSIYTDAADLWFMLQGVVVDLAPRPRRTCGVTPIPSETSRMPVVTTPSTIRCAATRWPMS